MVGIEQQVKYTDCHHSNRTILPHRSIRSNSHSQRENGSSEESHNHQTGNFVFLSRQIKQTELPQS